MTILIELPSRTHRQQAIAPELPFWYDLDVKQLPQYCDHKRYPLGCGIRQAVWESNPRLRKMGRLNVQIWREIRRCYQGSTNRELMFITRGLSLAGGVA